MHQTRDRYLFWVLVAVQAAGSQAIIWTGLPVYRRLLSHSTEGAGAWEFAVSLSAVVAMQVAYWINYRLQPRLSFGRHTLAGHLFGWLGEISYFFPHAMAAVIVFDRIHDLDVTVGKMLALAVILFAVYCYKFQLETLGEALLHHADVPDASLPAPHTTFVQ